MKKVKISLLTMREISGQKREREGDRAKKRETPSERGRLDRSANDLVVSVGVEKVLLLVC